MNVNYFNLGNDARKGISGIISPEVFEKTPQTVSIIKLIMLVNFNVCFIVGKIIKTSFLAAAIMKIKNISLRPQLKPEARGV